VKIRDFIKWLKAQDQDLEVLVIKMEENRFYEGDIPTWVYFNPESHFTILSGNIYLGDDSPY
jgi:hypothetical protein